MWLVLTVLCAVLTYASALYFDSLIPAFIFLIASVIFLAATWNSRKSRR
jgi:hypothetical protein